MARCEMASGTVGRISVRATSFGGRIAATGGGHYGAIPHRRKGGVLRRMDARPRPSGKGAGTASTKREGS